VNMGSAGNGMHLRRPEVQKAYREKAREVGLELGSLAMGETNSVNLVTEPRAAIWLLDSVDAARGLGVKVVLVAMFFKGEVAPSDAEGIRRLVDLLKEVAPRAERAGVILGLENYHSAADNLKVIEKVGSPAVQVYYDVGNSTDKEYDILKELRLLGKEGRLCELHGKDGPHLFGAPGSRVDFPKVREALDSSGWTGWIHIEGAAPHGVVADYRRNLEFLRGIFPRAV
jgi:L-ribulose-5-phosphate 3-epimerase